MKVIRIVVGKLETNCYILVIDNDALIIDPGDSYDKIKSNLGNLNLQGILITHRHFDHIGALHKFNNVKIYEYSNLNEASYEIGKFKFDVIYTFGHTKDSITFYFKGENTMFTGDFIFKKSIGRTDLETGNEYEMKKSIEKIKKYKNAVIYPGHGDETTLENEIKNNPFFFN